MGARKHAFDFPASLPMPRGQLIRPGFSPRLPPNDCFRVFLDPIDLHREPQPVIHPGDHLLLRPLDGCQFQLPRRLSLCTLHDLLLGFDREGRRSYHLFVGYRQSAVSAHHLVSRRTSEQTGCGEEKACCDQRLSHFSILSRQPAPRCLRSSGSSPGMYSRTIRQRYCLPFLPSLTWSYDRLVG
jgi:hypothetical protein